MFKIIEDPFVKAKWLITEEGIVKEGPYYKGAVPFHCLTEPDQFLSELDPFFSTRGLLETMVNQGVNIYKRNNDIVRNLTLDEYLIVNDTLLQKNLKYNKKKNELIYGIFQNYRRQSLG